MGYRKFEDIVGEVDPKRRARIDALNTRTHAEDGVEEWHPCYDTAESEEHLADLKLAHGPPTLDSKPTPTPPEQLERMRAAADERFARRTPDDQARFLRALPADEAARILERVGSRLREGPGTRDSSGQHPG